MRVVFNKEVFLDKLILASKFTSNKLINTNALQGVMLQFDKKFLHFYSSNLSSFFHTKLNYQSEKELRVVVDPRKIIEFLTLLPSGEIEVEFKQKQIIIFFNKTRGSFPLIDFEDFPTPPPLKTKMEEIDKEIFNKKLPLVMFSSSQDESRPVLTGVNFVTDEDHLLMVATDGFRLSLLKTKKTTNFPSLIIPANILDEVVRLGKNEKNNYFSYFQKEKIITFILGDIEIYSRLIEGDFPPYEKVIPIEKKTSIILNKDELLRNIKITSVFAKDFSNVVVFECSNEGLRIRPKINESEENNTFQEIEFEGEEQKVAFNYRFLIDFLSRLGKEKKIKIEILRSDAPVVFKILGNNDYLHIIMPVRIQE
jgi:DNA polymerase-3 subunit beta